MAPQASTLAWKIPWMEEPGRLRSMGSLRVGQDWATYFHFSLSCIGEGNGNPLQGSCLENPRDGGAWWAAVYGVTQSRTQLKSLSSSSSRSLITLSSHRETPPKCPPTYRPVHEFFSVRLFSYGPSTYLILQGIAKLLSECTPSAKLYWAPIPCRHCSSHGWLRHEQNPCLQWACSWMQEVAMYWEVYMK